MLDALNIVDSVTIHEGDIAIVMQGRMQSYTSNSGIGTDNDSIDECEMSSYF